MPSQADGRSAEAWMQTFDNLFRMMTTMQAAWTPGHSGTARPDDERAAPQVLLDFAAQASMACLNSGVRCWQRMAALSGNSSASIGRTLMEMQAQPPAGEDAQGRLRDALRAYFREIADVPSQEAQRLQAELAHLEQQFWPSADAQPDSPYWRRWGVKP